MKNLTLELANSQKRNKQIGGAFEYADKYSDSIIYSPDLNEIKRLDWHYSIDDDCKLLADDLDFQINEFGNIFCRLESDSVLQDLICDGSNENGIECGSVPRNDFGYIGKWKIIMRYLERLNKQN